jgi:vacuolar-type H+-ATPase subunit H
MGNNKTLRDHASELATTLAPHVENARDKAAPVLADARDKAAPYVADVRDKAAPLIADAREKATPYVADARDKFTSEVLPVMVAALAAVDGATEEARAEALKRGKAVAAALKGEVPAPEPTHRLRNVLVALGLGGAAYALYKKFGGSQPTTNWQSSYTPPPAPTPAPAGGPVATPATGAQRPQPDDVAASDPAEAAADATDVPHDATTPDNPVTEIDVDPSHKA